MNEPKWTPGPWSEHGNGGCECGQIFGPDGNAVIAIVQGPTHLGLNGPDCVPNRQGQIANARLISAAPTMALYIKKRADGGDAEAAEIWENINASR